MILPDLLDTHRHEIVDEAARTLARSRLEHYDEQGFGAAHEKLSRLLAVTVRCVRERDLRPMLSYADAIARERRAAGFDLREVQMAFNVLEEAIWRQVVPEVPRDHLAEVIGLLTTIHGAGKDEVARTWVELVTQQQVGSLDLTAALKRPGSSPGG